MVGWLGHSSGMAHCTMHRPRVHRGRAAARLLALLALLHAGGEAGADNKSMASANRLSKDELMATGEQIYNDTCSGCHQVNGMGIAGVYPPLVAGAPFAGAEFLTQPLEARGFLKDGRIQLGPIENHIEAVANGIPNSRMFAFSGLLSDAEIAAVVTYERNAWGNDSGDVVQPAQVKAVRQGS